MQYIPIRRTTFGRDSAKHPALALGFQVDSKQSLLSLLFMRSRPEIIPSAVFFLTAMRERQGFQTDLDSNSDQNLALEKTHMLTDSQSCRFMFDQLDYASCHDSCSISEVHLLMATCWVAQLIQRSNSRMLIAINHHTAFLISGLCRTYDKNNQ